MAYELLSTSSQDITGTLSSVGTPHTLVAWAKPNNLTGDHRAIRISNANSAANFIACAGTSTNDPASAISRTSSAVFYTASSTTTYSTSSWNNVAGVFSATNSRTIYLDAAGSSTNTDTTDTSSFTVLLLGAASGTTSVQLCSTAIWSAVLTDAELASLTKGFKPSRIRPQSLVFYAPLTRDLNDIRGGITLTASGAPQVVTNPRVI